MIEFDRAKRDELRKAYNDAVANNLKVFTIDGQEILTAYAKYLLEHLDYKLGKTQ